VATVSVNFIAATLLASRARQQPSCLNLAKLQVTIAGFAVILCTARIVFPANSCIFIYLFIYLFIKVLRMFYIRFGLRLLKPDI
jgi:hypothetical protein